MAEQNTTKQAIIQSTLKRRIHNIRTRRDEAIETGDYRELSYLQGLLTGLLIALEITGGRDE